MRPSTRALIQKIEELGALVGMVFVVDEKKLSTYEAAFDWRERDPMKARIVMTYPLEQDGSEYVLNGIWEEVDDTKEGLGRLDEEIKHLSKENPGVIYEVEIQGNTIPDLKMLGE